MAYAFTVTLYTSRKKLTYNGTTYTEADHDSTVYVTPDTYLLRIDETGTGANDQWSFTPASLRLPTTLAIASLKASLTAGAGATIDPVAGKVTAPDAAAQPDVFYDGPSGALAHDHNFSWTRPIECSGNAWFGKSRVDAGSNNTIRTELLLVRQPGG